MTLNGLGVSPGIGIGRALVVTRGIRNLRFRIPERRVGSEIARLTAARASCGDFEDCVGCLRHLCFLRFWKLGFYRKVEGLAGVG